MLALRPLPSLLSFHHLLCAVNIPNPWIQDHWFVQALPENPHQISWTISWPIWGLSISKTCNEKTEIEFETQYDRKD